MTTLFYSLVVAAVSGLTFLAYKHPRAYDRIFPILNIIILFALVTYFSWQLSGDVLFKALSPYMDSARLMEASDAHKRHSLLSLQELIGIVVLQIYLLFLSVLERIIGQDPPKPS